MNLFNYISEFISETLGRRNITDRMRVIAQKYDEVVLPTLEQIREETKLTPPVSAYGKAFVKSFNATLPSNMRNSQNDYIVVAHKSLANAADLVGKLEKVINKEMADTVRIHGLTYQKATLLRIIELLDFTADYASRQLAFYVASEVEKKTKGKDTNPYTKAEEAVLRTYQSTYFKTIEMFYQPADVVLKKVASIPEVLMTGDVSHDLPTIDPSKVDPLKLGFIPVVSHIWNFFGNMYVDWEYSRYEKAKKERRDIELRIEMLKQYEASGQPNARLESILDGYNRELTLLREKISQMESKVARGN